MGRLTLIGGLTLMDGRLLTLTINVNAAVTMKERPCGLSDSFMFALIFEFGVVSFVSF